MTSLLHPCPGARITQLFGEHPEWYVAYGYPGHPGLDFSCVVGTPLRAPVSGMVQVAGSAASTTGYGLNVRIHLDDGRRYVLLGHLSATLVQGRVEAGDVVALSGNSGRSFAPHVHVGFYDKAEWPDGDYFGWIDPLPYIGEEEIVAPSKITWHVQTLSRCPWLKDVLANSPIDWLKLMNPPSEDDCPVDPQRVKIDGRPWIGGDDVEMNEFILNGSSGAASYYERCREFYERAPYVHAWEGPNEPFMGDAYKRKMYVEFMIALADHMHAHGQRIVGGSLAVGWPDWPDVNDLIPMAREMDFMGYHGYSAPIMSERSADHTLRYRGIIERWADAGFDSPPWLLTETGLDGGVAPIHCAKTGWKTWASGWEPYKLQLQWLDKEIAKDPLVEAAMVYTLGAESDWTDFELGESEVRDFTAYQRSVEPIGVTDAQIIARAHEVVLPLNPDAGLAKAGMARGMTPASDEDNALGFPIQVFRTADDYGRLHIGVWQNGQVRWLEDEN